MIRAMDVANCLGDRSLTAKQRRRPWAGGAASTIASLRRDAVLHGTAPVAPRHLGNPEPPCARESNAATLRTFSNTHAHGGILVGMEALPFSREQLLSQTAWLQALALQLATQRADAEDAAQQTWLHALAAPAPHSIRRWRPFLAVTLRNALALTRRGERRRAARDRLVADRDARDTECTAELVARLDLHRHLAALVLELAEPRRRLVLHHYFAGASIAELAAQNRMTAAAVRGHLHRARAWLRARLAADDGAAGRAFAALAATAGAPLLGVTSTLAMKTKLPAFAALLALVGFTWWLAAEPRTAPPPPPDPRTPIAVVAPVTVPTAGPAAARTEVAAREAIDPRRPWVLRGELMHGSVGPLPGTSFTASVYAGRRNEGEPLQRAVLTSDATGAFAWPLPPPQAAVTIVFSSHGRDASVLHSPRVFEVGDEPPQDLQVYAFLRDCRARGRVTDEDGGAIPGAWVKADPEDDPQPCALDGSYDVKTTATYGDTTLSAGAPGYTLARQTASARGRQASVAIDFRLRRAACLQGRVLGTDGPVAGATVHTLETWMAKVRTDAEGRFEIAHLDPGRDGHTVQVEHPGYARLQRWVAAADVGKPCELVLERGARVHGRVVGADRRALEGARIHLGDFGLSGQPDAHTGADGSFEILGVRPGPRMAYVLARGHAPQQRAIRVPAGEPNAVELDVQLDAGHWVAGRIVDHDGQGLHRIRVQPLGTPHWQLCVEVNTARDGTFRLTDLPAGKITLDCFGMDVVRKEEANVAVDQGGAVIVLERAGKLAGRVVDDATGAAVTRFSIRVVDSAVGLGVEWTRGIVFEDAEGRWDSGIERFPPDSSVCVEASAVGYGPAVGNAIAQVDATSPLVLRLRRGARIEGHVVDQQTGAAIASALVVAFTNEQPLRGDEPLDEARLARRTDGEGAFVIDGVPPGTVWLVVRHPQWPLTFDGPFAAGAGTAVVRRIAIEPGGVLRGIVLDAHGDPVAGARIAREAVTIRSVKVPDAETRTDAAGRFAFTGLPTATFRLRGTGSLVDGSVIVYPMREVDATAGRDVDVTFDASGTGAIELELTSDSELPTTLRVLVTSSGGHDVHLVEVASATPIVRGLPAGEVRVMLLPGAVRSEATGTVTTGATTRLQLSLTSRPR